MRQFLRVCLLGLLTGCGGGSDGEGLLDGMEKFGCDDPPACYLDALAVVRGCFTGTVLSMSGDARNMVCSAGEVSVRLSAFNENPTGLVPEPSSATIEVGGSTCAMLSWGDGTHTDGPTGVTTAFLFAAIETPGGGEVVIRSYETGDVSVECGIREFGAAAGTLDGCPGGLLVPEFERTDDLSSVGVVLVAGDGSREDLFACE